MNKKGNAGLVFLIIVVMIFFMFKNTLIGEIGIFENGELKLQQNIEESYVSRTKIVKTEKCTVVFGKKSIVLNDILSEETSTFVSSTGKLIDVSSDTDLETENCYVIWIGQANVVQLS